MRKSAKLSCKCGQVKGIVHNANTESVNRVVCYCDDCQAFLHYLGRAELLDEHGGSDIIQVAPAELTIETGANHIAVVNLKPGGLNRFYTTCCKTPLGNTLTPSVPFIGIVAQAFESPDEFFGPPRFSILGKFAIGTPPAESLRLKPSSLFRIARLIIGWKLRGRTWPHPYFSKGSKEPLYPRTVLTKAERDALRPLCGPKP